MNINDIVKELNISIKPTLLEGFDTAIIGITNDNRLAYSLDKICEIISHDKNISFEAASDYITYNVLPGFEMDDVPYKPVFVYELREK